MLYQSKESCVYIEKLTLKNYRGVSKLELELNSKLNVFYGVNGSGKSTMLDASAIMLSWLVSRIRRAGSSGRPIADSDIKNKKSACSINIAVKVDDKHEYEKNSLMWKLVRSRTGHSSGDEKTSLSELNEYTKHLQRIITLSEEQCNLPLLAYYPINRAVLDIPLKIRTKHRFNLLEMYDDALAGGASFRAFFEWFREREDLENEAIRDQQSLFDDTSSSSGFPDIHLNAVRSALESLMPDFKNLTVRRSPLRMEVEKKGKKLNVSQLSDGEKCLMAMVGDLARRLAIANPKLKKPLEGEGIVLIDEIDLHLHPKWQRMIVPKLQKTFPNCQFIVSTHSPHVITHVKPECLFMLKQTSNAIKATHPNESYGKNVTRILEDLMGLKTTRPDKVSKELSDIFNQIDLGSFDKAKQEIKALRKEIGDDPDLVKAEVLIKRKELIGK